MVSGAVSWRAMVSPMGNSASSSPMRKSVSPIRTRTNPATMRRRFGGLRRSTATWNTTRMATMGATSTAVESAVAARVSRNSTAHTAMP